MCRYMSSWHCQPTWPNRRVGQGCPGRRKISSASIVPPTRQVGRISPPTQVGKAFLHPSKWEGSPQALSSSPHHNQSCCADASTHAVKVFYNIHMLLTIYMSLFRIYTPARQNVGLLSTPAMRNNIKMHEHWAGIKPPTKDRMFRNWPRLKASPLCCLCCRDNLYSYHVTIVKSNRANHWDFLTLKHYTTPVFCLAILNHCFVCIPF